MEAIPNFETKLDTIHAELRKENVTKKKLADLLSNRHDLLRRWEKLVAANKALLKSKYQSMRMDDKGDRLCRYREEMTSLDGRKENLGQMLTICWSLSYEGQLKVFIQLQNSKTNNEKMLLKNKVQIEKNRDALCDSRNYKTLLKNGETLKTRAENVASLNGLLKTVRGDSSIYRRLHRMEGVIPGANVDWQEQQLKSRDTSPETDAIEGTQCTIGFNSFANIPVNGGHRYLKKEFSVEAKHFRRAREQQLVLSYQTRIVYSFSIGSTEKTRRI